MRLLLCFVALFARFVSAEEPFLRPNDVIAIVGGEDMVVVSKGDEQKGMSRVWERIRGWDHKPSPEEKART